jgi:LmbE family N-acetylglucosaminyl deacetylase
MLDGLQPNDRILVLSPHLDDAVLSVGGIMHRAASQGIKVVTGTICTADAPATISASPTVRQKHAAWGLGPNPYSVRRTEDIEAVQSLHAHYLHGEKLDAIYRTDRWGKLLYPSPPSRFSQLSRHDPLPSSLRNLLIEWLSSVEPAVVLSPLGVGQHVDHVITSEALRRVALNAGVDRVFLYEDLPYSAGYYGSPDTVPDAIQRSGWTVEESSAIAVDVRAKIAAVKQYRSQMSSVFPDGRDPGQELKSYMAGGPDVTFQERVWSARP